MNFVPRSEETRRRIIETTAELFNKKGYNGTTLSDLTAATKLTKGGIYGNFKNKEDIAVSVFEYNLAVSQKSIDALMAREKTIKNKILAHIDAYYAKNADTRLPGGCPLQNTAIEADDTHEGLRKKASYGFMTWKKVLADLITKGVENGEFRTGIDPDKMAFSLIAIIEGSVLLGRTMKQNDVQAAILDTAKSMVENFV
ncbi:TetR/AcrR family transcriptional regulator [Dyadobacter frigoris]|uniref:TetR/AcrR family transcriptional regulator n=1 Tax=Dyadobacter frigoris TaxID=2576211 RepID=A0A4U6DB23_9BACT|nr:TetR/AcrR family transcriptional regulator [Dyadobacter frigoris]TKT93408.1 TetR/AcrR family transcriptional regulator [Dyadobacter frigoris]GLU54721.1 transcriptional regulator [Dyadobacter frigoris]